MIVKLGKIINSVSAFKTLAGQVVSAKTSFRIAKILNVLQKELDVFEETKNSLVAKHQTMNEAGSLELTKENMEIAKKSLEELLEMEVTLDVQPMNISDLAGINITNSNMMLMEFIFTE